MRQRLFNQAARMISTKNTLGNESSPYLLQHRENPVHWYPWGEEAFRIARQLDRPIFLSIGYSTCHWCHVMERESFEDQGTADLLNEHFVSVKVDREERPDLDRAYMTYVQAITGSGGWPLSIFIDAEGKPFLGGTYFPPQPAHGRPSFKQLLAMVSRTWQERREHVGETADLSMRMLKQVNEQQKSEQAVQLSLTRTIDAFRDAIDPIHGGLGPARGPKFPCAPSLLFLQRSGSLQPLLQLTLKEMARGGIYDHLEGGFHRYSVDGHWLVPHFEKMLYDQALLLMLYSRHQEFNWVTHGILDYVTRHLSHPAGAIFAAEDADSLTEGSEKHEGAWCVWKESEIREALGQQFNVNQIEQFIQAYGVKPEGNFEHGQNILHLTTEYDSYLEPILKTLLHFRQQRPRPARDDKVIAAWNGLWLKAISQVALIHQSSEGLQQAKQLALFIEDQMIQNDKLLRCWYPDQKGKTIEGFAEDYGMVITGLLQLSQSVLRMERDVQASNAFLNLAQRLQATMDRLFYREGGYVTGEHLTEFKDDYDGAEPSANGMAFLNQVRWRQLALSSDKANEMLSWYQSRMAKQPLSCPMAWLAWFEMEHGISVTIPNPNWIPSDVHDPDVLFVLQTESNAAHICKGNTCGPPISDPADLYAALKSTLWPE